MTASSDDDSGVNRTAEADHTDSSSSSCSRPRLAIKRRPLSDKVYQRQDFAALNVLRHPVWVFDFEKQCMYWANISALEVWDAPSLEELLARDFSFSEATAKHVNNMKKKLDDGSMLTERWTSYPRGVARTLDLTFSQIRIDDNRIANLIEAELVSHTESFEHHSIRGIHIMRYVPIPICQYDGEGTTLQYENPEAMEVFGHVRRRADSEDDSIQEEHKMNLDDEIDDGSSRTLASENQFLARFVDKALGQKVLSEIDKGQDSNVEAEQYTKEGAIRLFIVSVRRCFDPITSKPVILYSARDLTEVLQARKETKLASQKSDFMAVVSHEIRTPLHHIMGHLELLEVSDGLNSSQKETIKSMQTSSASLTNIIDDMVCYSSLEHGKLKLQSIVFDPSTVLNSCIKSIELEVQEKGLQLQNHQHGLPPRVMGDPHRLRQILSNLLDNSTKFTELGSISTTTSVIKIPGDDSKTQLRIEVMDTGIGIHPHHHSRIFIRYEQVDSHIGWKYGGTGLGLSICKHLVDLMGGTIVLESELGKGTKFTIDIPFDLPKEDQQTRQSTSMAATKTTTDADTEKSELRIPSEELHVLVVEDNMVNQKMAKKMLQRLGHTVTVANNGQEAVDEIKQNAKSYDLILMDVQMPILDGIKATEKIRGMPSLGKNELPIVGLTASFEQSTLGYYQEIGMNTCIGKPVRMNTLKRVIESCTTTLPTAKDVPTT